MRYVSSLKWTENVTKAVSSPGNLGLPFTKDSQLKILAISTLVWLNLFEVHLTYSPFAARIQNCLKPHRYKNVKTRHNERGSNTHKSEKPTKNDPSKNEVPRSASWFCKEHHEIFTCRVKVRTYQTTQNLF